MIDGIWAGGMVLGVKVYIGGWWALGITLV